MRPRIVFLSGLTLWSMGKGHGGPAFTQTIQKYIREGWEVFLISDVPSNRDYPDLDSAHNILLEPTGFKRFTGIRKLGLAFHLLDHWIMNRRMERAAEAVIGRRTEKTILYAYEDFALSACRRLSSRLGLPLVTRVQGTRVTAYFDLPFKHLRMYPQVQMLEAPADLMIMTDDGSSGEETARRLGNRGPICFWRNGLELLERDIPAMRAAFDRGGFRETLGVKDDEIMFLTVSRLVGWKKVDRALDGLAQCLKAAPNARLVVVGDGDARAALEAKAGRLGIADRVAFTGAVPHDQVYDYMMACDVFVSLYDLSNVGNPLLEAMTLGKCIVTLDVGTTRDLIRHRENGILMTYDTLPSLGDVFAELAGDEALRARLGEAAASYAQAHFWTWTERMDAELQAVSGLLKGSD